MADASVVHEAFATLVKAKELERVPVGGRMSMGHPYAKASHLLVRGIKHCARIRAGDFILFDGPGGWIAHRVIWVLPGPKYVTKGDANRAFDRPYPGDEQLLGKVIGFVVDEQERRFDAAERVRAGIKILQGLLLWIYHAFLIRVLKKEIRVEDLA